MRRACSANTAWFLRRLTTPPRAVPRPSLGDRCAELAGAEPREPGRATLEACPAAEPCPPSARRASPPRCPRYSPMLGSPASRSSSRRRHGSVPTRACDRTSTQRASRSSSARGTGRTTATRSPPSGIPGASPYTLRTSRWGGSSAWSRRSAYRAQLSSSGYVARATSLRSASHRRRLPRGELAEGAVRFLQRSPSSLRRLRRAVERRSPSR